MRERSKTHQLWWSRGPVILTGILLFVTIGALALFFIPGMLLNHWFPTNTDTDTMNKTLGTAAQIVLFTLGGAIALVGVGVSLSRHGQEIEAAERDRHRAELQNSAHQLDKMKESQRRREHELERAADTERTLRTRFVAAVELLSQTDSAIKRTAGLYAIAALADDWQALGRLDERQVCIDVLCGYLRAPIGDGEDTPDDEEEVRQTGYTLIRDHLRATGDDAPRWTGATIPLTGASIDFDLNLSGMVLQRGTFLKLDRVKLRNATLNLHGTRAADGGRLSLFQAEVDGADVDIKRSSIVDNGAINLSESTFTGGSTLSLNVTRVGGGSSIDLINVMVGDRSIVCLDDVKIFEKSSLDMFGAKFGASAELSLERITVEHDSTAGLNASVQSGTSVRTYLATASNNSKLTLPQEDRPLPWDATASGGESLNGEVL